MLQGNRYLTHADLKAKVISDVVQPALCKSHCTAFSSYSAAATIIDDEDEDEDVDDRNGDSAAFGGDNKDEVND